ncbi:MAG TPA: efflux RND transporter periplasmic adaptor subunit [Verrucomicrobiae bacterium]|nr:efflux RND transporter periplasmic adaptor subunit [Verrucomicrobiae bacterium]
MAAKRKTTWLKWVLALLAIAAAGAGWRWYADRPDDSDVEYRKSPVAKGDIVQSVTANGQITPVKNVQVGSQISGIIKELYSDFNERVTNGQVVAQIDPSTYQQNLTLAEAELANAKASLEFAELNYKRNKGLGELVAANDLDRSLADLHQAQAVVKTREASVNKAKVDLERTTIYAPIDGVVISRNVDVGQTVAASFTAPTLFVVANDLTKMQIEAAVSEADVGGIETGQQVDFSVDAFPGRTFHGEVKQVRYAPVTNQNVVTYTTIVEVSNPDLKLRPGMTATASIITAQRNHALKIPNAALRFRPPETIAAATTNTQAPAGSAPRNGGDRMASGGGSGGGRGERGGGGGGDNLRERMQNMSPEERAAMRARFAGQNAARRPPGEASMVRTVYVMQDAKDGKKPVLKPVKVKIGISDGKDTEILEGLNEGDVVVVGVNTPALAANAPNNARPGGSPFGGPFGGGFRPR